MQLYCECPNCSNENRFTSYSSTRIDFAMDNGEKKRVECSDCGFSNDIHVNNIFAKKSKIAIVIAVSFVLIGFPVLIYISFYVMKNTIIIGTYLAAPFLIYMMINRDEQNRISNFNNTFISNRNN